MTAAALSLGALLAGCPDGDDPPDPAPDGGPEAQADGPIGSVCPTGYLGDPKLDPVIELRALKADGSYIRVQPAPETQVLNAQAILLKGRPASASQPATV